MRWCGCSVEFQSEKCPWSEQKEKLMHDREIIMFPSQALSSICLLFCVDQMQFAFWNPILSFLIWHWMSASLFHSFRTNYHKSRDCQLYFHFQSLFLSLNAKVTRLAVVCLFPLFSIVLDFCRNKYWTNMRSLLKHFTLWLHNWIPWLWLELKKVKCLSDVQYLLRILLFCIVMSDPRPFVDILFFFIVIFFFNQFWFESKVNKSIGSELLLFYLFYSRAHRTFHFVFKNSRTFNLNDQFGLNFQITILEIK